ncbi:Acetate kinase [Buchnera aphidicola (Tetraneura ulmi)]|uniref:acetate kinase n=1 Tax=Buchnera aphidicola TaxID=9 RepID=UPI003464CE6D
MKYDKLVLVLNCGSSSLKFSIIDTVEKKVYLSGLAERLYLKDTRLIWSTSHSSKKNIILFNKEIDHNEILKIIKKEILFKNKELFNRIGVIGHRVVHGGRYIKKTTIIDKKVISHIHEASIFSPLHNPINLLGINFSLENFPKLYKRNVAVFDTSFFYSMKEKSYLYAIPYSLYNDYGIRKYGAHGTSHKYVCMKASTFLKKPFSNINIISCHLGNGSSISAIKNGICVDTSMGLTPLEGLVMGTRSGDIDPSIIFFMYEKLHYTIKEINELLINKSGLLGLSQSTSDFRDLELNYYSDERAKLAIDIFCFRLRKYISSYFSLMDGELDGIVFTGGIGENSSLVREKSLKNLSWFGNIFVDYKKNNNSFKKNDNLIIDISKNSNVPILVIPTDEEFAIAKESFSLFF